MAASVIAVAACSDDYGGDAQDATEAAASIESPVTRSSIPATVDPPQSSAAAAVDTTEDPAISTHVTAVRPTTTTDPPPPPSGTGETDVELGQSVGGRPITAIRRGTPGGTPVLVVGVIHGDEDAGASIVEVLRRAPVPEGIELWLVPSMNPDGQAAGTRQNANGVDLNRNFPTNWAPLAQPGDWQYAGSAPASEPETKAMIALSEQVRPNLTLWYHQDLFRINPATGLDGEIRQTYAALTGLPIIEVTGGTYTGTASQWSRTIAAEDGIGFTVELGHALSGRGARRHAAAVLTIAAEL